MKNTRYVNGYVLIYDPSHPKAMSSKNWNGYVYEHIVVAMQMLGRPLRPEEVVHHLDFNKTNNRQENLLVLERSQHIKLHSWLAAGAIRNESSDGIGVNSGNALGRCKICNTLLQHKQKEYCSRSCTLKGAQGKCPSKEELEQDLKVLSFLAIGRKYAVSDNAVRKWCRKYQLPDKKRILSQAEGTPSEGATTTGEVESS